MSETTDRITGRIASIDIIRGAVMILMAIDHVRVFSGISANAPSVGVFITRWITHFCAPAFIFLAGTSAYLYGRKHQDLPKFLLTRGAWLVFLELTVIRIGWTFNFDFAQYELAGVIWVIGWCMILMAGLVKLPLPVVGGLGLVIIGGHNLLGPHMREIIPTLGNDFGSALWKVLYVGFYAGPVSFGQDGPNLVVLYSLIPWVGVMAAGYAFGRILTLEPSSRNRWCYAIGLGAILLFVILRGFNLYGDVRPLGLTIRGEPLSAKVPFIVDVLNTTKYPASLAFLLMTLGPTIVLIPFLEKSRGFFSKATTLFGRVPFFFYVLHIPLIHILAVIVSLVRSGEVNVWLFTNIPMASPPAPEEYVWSLGLLYAVWAVAVVILYYACRWFWDLKARRTDWWLRYL